MLTYEVAFATTNGIEVMTGTSIDEARYLNVWLFPSVFIIVYRKSGSKNAGYAPLKAIPTPSTRLLFRYCFLFKKIIDSKTKKAGIASNIPQNDDKIIVSGLKRYNIIAPRAVRWFFVFVRIMVSMVFAIAMSTAIIGNFIAKLKTNEFCVGA